MKHFYLIFSLGSFATIPTNSPDESEAILEAGTENSYCFDLLMEVSVPPPWRGCRADNVLCVLVPAVGMD